MTHTSGSPSCPSTGTFATPLNPVLNGICDVWDHLNKAAKYMIHISSRSYRSTPWCGNYFPRAHSTNRGSLKNLSVKSESTLAPMRNDPYNLSGIPTSAHFAEAFRFIILCLKKCLSVTKWPLCRHVDKGEKLGKEHEIPALFSPKSHPFAPCRWQTDQTTTRCHSPKPTILNQKRRRTNRWHTAGIQQEIARIDEGHKKVTPRNSPGRFYR